MLTEKAMRERDWRGFPLLQQVLENQPSPQSRFSSFCSADETVFERLGRLTRIVAGATEHREKVLALARSSPDLHHSIAEELWNLRREIDGLRHIWDREIEAAKELSEAVRRNHP